jgi:hypothetical protein
VSFAQRFALVLLAAFFLSSLVCSLLAYLCAGPVLRRIASQPSALAIFRLLPSVMAIGVTMLVLAPGYYVYEQRADLEGAGRALWIASAGGAALLLSSLARALYLTMGTARLRRSWLRTARATRVPGAGMQAFEIEVPFPMVAVLGALQPRLFIAGSVLRACTPAELSAIVEHERAHVARADNLVRMIMDVAPDFLAVTPLARRIARSWHEAVELRADAAARKPVDLASALVRVARLAQAPSPAALPASALYRGDGVADRVRALLEGRQPSADGLFAGVAAACALLLTALACASVTDAGMRWAHAVLEAAVTLP